MCSMCLSLRQMTHAHVSTQKVTVTATGTSQAVSMTVQSMQLILKGLQKAARGKPCDCNTREYHSCISRAFQPSLSGTMGQNSHHLTLLQR